MNWIVISAHKSKVLNPIKFQVGDVVKAGKTDHEFPGWIWVSPSDGNQGWAPIQYLQLDVSGRNVIAIRSYSAQDLDTSNGEILELHWELNGWGWVGNEEKRFGWVPMDRIQLIP